MMNTILTKQPRLIAFWCHCCGQQVIEDHPIGWAGDECARCSRKLGRGYELLDAAVVAQALEDLTDDEHEEEATEARQWLRSIGVLAIEHEQPALSE